MTLQKAINDFGDAFDNMVKVMKKERFVQKLLFFGFLLWSLNISITSFIYMFKHPDKTQTEVFLHIPRSFEWNFK